MKKFILMLIACLVLSSSIVYGASVIRSAYFNEGLTLAVNNQSADVRFVTVELEGEQYGRNYVSVADFVKALNDYAGLNATVDFDSKTQTIIVDSKVMESNVDDATTGTIDTGGDIVSEQEVPLNKYGLPDFSNYAGEKPAIENDGVNAFKTVNEVKYIRLRNYERGNPNNPFPENFRFERLIENGKFTDKIAFETRDKETKAITMLIEEVPYAYLDDFYVPYDYYLNTILPLTQGAE